MGVTYAHCTDVFRARDVVTGWAHMRAFITINKLCSSISNNLAAKFTSGNFIVEPSRGMMNGRRKMHQKTLEAGVL